MYVRETDRGMEYEGRLLVDGGRMESHKWWSNGNSKTFANFDLLQREKEKG